MTKGRAGIILILVSIALSLDQLLRFHRWEWNQMPTLWHHEGIALFSFIAGSVLMVISRRAQEN